MNVFGRSPVEIIGRSATVKTIKEFVIKSLGNPRTVFRKIFTVMPAEIERSSVVVFKDFQEKIPEKYI